MKTFQDFYENKDVLEENVFLVNGNKIRVSGNAKNGITITFKHAGDIWQYQSEPAESKLSGGGSGPFASRQKTKDYIEIEGWGEMTVKEIKNKYGKLSWLESALDTFKEVIDDNPSSDQPSSKEKFFKGTLTNIS